MYAAALALTVTTTATTTGLPFFQLGAWDIGIPIQAFGVIVAIGVLIGASILRRYGEWHKVSDDTIRGLTGWITVTGFIGAHVFDVVAYQWAELQKDPVLLIKLWAGISSYGGFIGGAMGFAFYVWWKRLPARLMADIGVIGLLPAFSIGRIGCTVVSDHIGRAGDPNAWYSFLLMDYPRYGDVVLKNSGIAHLVQTNPGTSEVIPAWNLGFIELLYLIPVNALLLYLAFRRKRPPAGFLVVLVGVLYAPVRFFMDYLRPETSDPRYVGLTFAQWSSILTFGVAAYFASRLLKGGAPAETMAPTSKEAQEMIRLALKEDDDADDKEKGKGKGKGKSDKHKKAPDKKPLPKATVEKELDPVTAEERRKAKELEDARAEERRKQDDAEEVAAAERRKKQDEEMEKKAAAKKAAEDAAKAAKAATAKPAEKAETKPEDKSEGDEGDEDPLDHGAPTVKSFDEPASDAKPQPAAKDTKKSGGTKKTKKK